MRRQPPSVQARPGPVGISFSWWDVLACARQQRPVLAQDPLLQGAQRRPRFEPELLRQTVASVLEDVESVALAAAAIQGEHELADEPLASRVARDERFEFADDHVGA